MTATPRPTAAAAVALFRKWFLNRTDVVAFLAPWAKPCPTAPVDGLDSASGQGADPTYSTLVWFFLAN